MENIINIKGKIIFDPADKTNKHNNQSHWKKIAMVVFESDICEYYSWLLKKRYKIQLNKPLRGPHISFINDSINDIKNGLFINEEEVKERWNYVKKIWNNKEIDVLLDVDMRTDSTHWWLKYSEKNNNILQAIRLQLGLNKPYYGLHMSVGYANDKNIEQSKYILGNINKFGKNYE